MDLEELRAVQTRERATDGLQELRESFYADVATYIQELREERDREAAEAEDPFRNPRVSELNNEIDVAEQVAEAIYERRIGKLVKQASLAAAGMPDDQTGLTAEEQELYSDLVERIRENKQGVLDVIAGDAPVETGSDETDESTENGADSSGESIDESPTQPDRSPAGAPDDGTNPEPSRGDPSDRDDAARERQSGSPDPGSESTGTRSETADSDSASTDSQSASADVERTTVRMTSDVGEIFGVDEEEYSLYENDVVTLPRENAEPLVERDAAEEVE